MVISGRRRLVWAAVLLPPVGWAQSSGPASVQTVYHDLPDFARDQTTPERPNGTSALAQLAASLSPGQWAVLATNSIDPTLTNTGGSSNMIFGYADAMKWDPVSRRMLYLGSDHGGNPTPGPNSNYRFVAYSEDTNTWSVLPTPPWVSVNWPSYNDAHGYDKTAINPLARRLYRNPFNSKQIHVCNLATGVWSLLPDPPNTGSSCCDAIEYFPERGGLVWSQGTGAQLFFDESSQQWSTLGSEVSLASTWMFAEHNPVHRVVILGSSTGALFRLSSSGGLSALGDIPVEVYDGSAWNGVVTVDPVSGDYLVLTPPSRQLHAYDVMTDTWRAIPSPPPAPGMDAVLGTPIAAYGVTAFTHCHHSGSCGVWLYKHAPAALSPALSVDDVTVTEGNAGTTAALFTVRVSPASAQAVTVGYATADGTAAAGSDYQAASGTVSFAPGMVTRTVSVNVVGDTAVEPDETFVLNLSAPAGATLGDGQGVGTISDDDAPSLARRELGHGSALWEDLSGQTGVAGQDAFRLMQAARSSYEVALDGVSGDASPAVLERLAADNVTVLQTGTGTGAGGGVSLRWENTSGSAVTNQHVRVSSGRCASTCGPDDVYRVRAWETTGTIARFNNGGSQVTVLVLQNPGPGLVSGRAHFWSGGGTLLATHAFTLGGHAALVLNTAGVTGLTGQAGSVTVTHDGGYGALAGKTVALEPASGFSFDSPLNHKPR